MIKFQHILLIILIGFVINIPFGYLRNKSKKYSFAWFSYIHIPVIFIIFLRLLFNTSFKYVPLFVIASIIGQILGSYIKITNT